MLRNDEESTGMRTTLAPVLSNAFAMAYIVPLYLDVMAVNPYWYLDEGSISEDRLAEVLRAGVTSMGDEAIVY